MRTWKVQGLAPLVGWGEVCPETGLGPPAVRQSELSIMRES